MPQVLKPLNEHPNVLFKNPSRAPLRGNLPCPAPPTHSRCVFLSYSERDGINYHPKAKSFQMMLQSQSDFKNEIV